MRIGPPARDEVRHVRIGPPAREEVRHVRMGEQQVRRWHKMQIVNYSR